MTLDDYDQMLIKQDHKCVICSRTPTELDKRLCVDHCHKTNKIRDLLCNNCNAGIGDFKHNVELLRNAIKYLEKHTKGEF